MMYKTCPECGANYDYGEICDCKRESRAALASEAQKQERIAIDADRSGDSPPSIPKRGLQCAGAGV
jgi:hypothetical protein